MKALRSFTVRARLPEPLAPLHALAYNLRWAWDERSRDLFRWFDPDCWEASGHDPVRLLGLVRRERLEAMASDPGFMAFMVEVHEELIRYVSGPRWFQGRDGTPLRSVAYFSPEFGITEALPQYSGGLGVLAGDHLKAASGLGLPLVGVSLFYKQGYFRQELNADGWQQERYPLLDPHAMALNLVDGARVSLDLAGTPLVAQVWRAQVGRVSLYLLDADVEENDEAGRAVTDRLYAGDAEHRIRQEILLGIGGVLALQAAGEEPQIFHTNEGHAGFLGLERIRQLVTGQGLRFSEAVEAVRAGTIFTTHTPVPAGIDRFPREMMERYFKRFADECKVPFAELMALGQEPGAGSDAPFNMAVMGLRLASLSNGVSKLHATVSRRMFSGLWPGVPDEETPILAVTNGVHARTWVSPEMDELLNRYVLPEWPEADEARWDRIEDAHDDEVWRVRDQGRARLVAFVRQRLQETAQAKGMSSDVAWTGEVLDPRVLTIGFARRFAAYKRATLLLSQPARLKALLTSSERPVQLIFAGKAHPADDVGKEMIRQIVQFSRDPEVRHRMAFVEDYDIVVARHMYQGADVWVNTPRRPLEACGTSGMKAALNGSPQLLHPRRLVGRDVRRGQRLGHLLGRDLRRPRPPGRGRGRQSLRAARTPDRAALLRALRRPAAPELGTQGQVVAAFARPPGQRLPDGAGLRGGDVRAGRRPGRGHDAGQGGPGPGSRGLEAAGGEGLGGRQGPRRGERVGAVRPGVHEEGGGGGRPRAPWTRTTSRSSFSTAPWGPTRSSSPSTP